MPSYTFEHRKTKKQKHETMTIAAMEQFLQENPDWFVVIQPLGVRDNFVASRHTNIPIDSDMRSLLKSMRDNNHGSTIDW